MLTVAYLANCFPAETEGYVRDEIVELESRGVQVIAASVRGSASRDAGRPADVVLLPISVSTILKTAWLCARRCIRLLPLMKRIALLGTESVMQRCKALAHTFLGACLAIRLENRGVEHIHVHHGYFGSWAGMTAARLMGAGFSFTLHGSDLLLHGAYLDTKLDACEFCFTVSEYNRSFILAKYLAARNKVFVSRLGVDVPNSIDSAKVERLRGRAVRILSVGRLHDVKDHAFLVQACAKLLERGVAFECSIAGEGRERQALEFLIRRLDLDQHVRLLGHVMHEALGGLYEEADVVVLTSKSEGIPVVLMEAMARGRVVLAPRITGIPELVTSGQTGFLYEPGNMEDFIDQILAIKALLVHQTAVLATGRSIAGPLATIRQAAYSQVAQNFNRSKNLTHFADMFLSRVRPQNEKTADENLVLQQI